jgi:L,D-transpeptidase YbiS
LGIAVPALALLVVVVGTAAVMARFGHAYRAYPLVASVAGKADGDARDLERRAARASAALQRLQPRGTYLVVDTYRNRLHVYRDGELLRTAVCSTGTGIVLRDPRNGREWVFDTPLGERIIENKRRNPVWAKPDWAFIEEGMLPPTDPNERFDDVSLGKYGLYMGDGYIIHGTLFKSLLGRRVTHGCIRLGDEDLEFVYNATPIGARVFLY